jgi:hypothetical protein
MAKKFSCDTQKANPPIVNRENEEEEVFIKIQSEMLRNDKNLLDFENGISRFISQFNVSIQNREGDGDERAGKGKVKCCEGDEGEQEKLCMSHFLVDLLNF